MTGVIDWTDLFAALAAANPGHRFTVEFPEGGRLHVSDTAARFIARGETVDVDGALEVEAFATTGVDWAVEHEYRGEV